MYVYMFNVSQVLQFSLGILPFQHPTIAIALFSPLSKKKCSMLSLKRSNDFPSLNPSDSSHLADNLYFNIFIFVHISDNLYCKSTRGRLHYRLQNKYSPDRLLLLLQTQCQDDFRNLSGCVLKILTAGRILQISIAWCQIEAEIRSFPTMYGKGGGRCGKNWRNKGFRPKVMPKTRFF